MNQLPGRWLLVLAPAMLAGCGSAPNQREVPAYGTEQGISVTPSRGGYYKNDGPGANVPDIDKIPDAEPRAEPMHRFANNPYTVMARSYTPMRAIAPFRERGLASWYGRMFHGHKTSSGEIYDMYGMTAAHPTLPIPSYARVTNLRNNRSVVVRVNDRGPFHTGRIIDLSFTAAAKLGYIDSGSAQVEVELIQPEDFGRYARRDARRVAPATTQAAGVAAAAAPIALISSARAADAQAGPGSVYLQLGSFSARENAEALRDRVARELEDLKQAIEIQDGGGNYRVRVGPFTSRDAAAAAADAVRGALQINPVFVAR